MAVQELVVVGAGPAGLAAALGGARAGHRVTVLEAAPVVGGMAGSFEIAGQLVDFGSHRLHPATDPGLLSMVRGLLGADLQLRPRNGRIRMGERWIAFPLQPADMVRQLPPRFAARLALDTVARPWRAARSGPGDSFEAELIRRLGPTVTTSFYGPYARKLYGLDPTDLDVELADRRVSARSPLAVAGRALRSGRAPSRCFYYPRLGFGQIAEALAGAAVDAGAEIRLGQRVDRIEEAGDRPIVWAGHRAFPADVVLSTAPAAVLAGALRPPAPPEVLAAADRLRTRAMVLVYLVLDRPRWTPYDAHYLPAADLPVSRVSEPKNYRHHPGDPPDTTVLCAEVPCWKGDERWTADPDDLAALVSEELARVGLVVPDPVGVEVRRLSSVYPVYERATVADRRLLDDFVRDRPRVLTFGRQGLGVPDNLHHVLAMGAAAAAAVGGGHDPVDRSAWRADLRAFSAHVVQD